MNALKALLAGAINGVAVIYFIVNKVVYWPYLLIMVLGSLAGGYGGAGFGCRLGGATIRSIVVLVGFGLAIAFFIRR